ncbi:MAG: hypothetical protein ACYTG4_12605, partial [Planctomycetota bacterium]
MRIPDSARWTMAALLLVWGVLASAVPAHAAKAPFDPAGVILSGTEKNAAIGKLPLALHLAAGGEAAADIADLEGFASGFTGTWTFEDNVLTVELEPGAEEGSPVTVTLTMKGSGKGKGTMVRGAGEPAPVKVKQLFPGRKAKGFTAVIPRLRHTGTTGAGAVRATVVIRNATVPKKKPKPLTIDMRVLTPDGLPGFLRTVEVLPGETVVLDGGELPGHLLGVESETNQYLLTARKKKGFDPASIEILAYEETLRNLDPSTSGTAVPVHWVAPLKKKALALRDAAPMVAPWFHDEGGGGGLRRAATLVLRDLSPHSGEPDLGSVLVSLFAVDGEPIGSGEVELSRGAAVSVSPWNLLDQPGDFSEVEGWLTVTAVGGGGIDRGRLSAHLDAPVADNGVVIASVVLPVEPLAPAGTTATLVAPWILVPEGGSASTALRVTNTDDATLNVPVRVLAPDGTTLHNTTVMVPAGEMRRVDPATVGMDLELLEDHDGRAQVLLGADGGLPLDTLAFYGEVVQQGDP